MVQTTRKGNLIVSAILLTLVLVLVMGVAILAAPSTETAHAATSVIDSLSLANINAGNAEGKYGNFSWDNTKIKSISASEMTTDRDEDPLCIVWTRPANGAYASALTFSVNITDSVGAITIRYDDPSVPSYISPGEKQSGTLTETVNSLYSTYEKIYFYISCSYMYNHVHLTSVSIQIKATTYKMTFTKGTGIKEAYLSTDSNATSGSASGTAYAKYSTIYCFAKLAEGYKAQSGWNLIGGTANSEDAIYRVGTRSNISAAYNFGTINATAKTKSLTRNTNGGGYMSGITLTYGQTANLTIPSRNGYTFLGWNTNADGTGATYGNGSAAELTASQVNAIIADSSINTVYAMWKIAPETVIGFIDAIPDPVVYSQACKDAIDTARSGYSDLSDDEKLLVTNYETLTAAEETYAGMQSDKESLDAYKIERKDDADDLAQVGDSVACATLISNAKNDIDAVVYDCTKTLDENKAVVDAIIDELEGALALQRDKEAFEAYKTPKKADADDLAEVGDSAACADLIAGAKAEIEDLDYDEEKTLDENKAAIDKIVSDLADALELQRKKDAFEAYKAPKKADADDLAEVDDSAACADLIAGAKAEIEDLDYDEEKSLAENKAVIDAIVADLADALDLQRNKEAFEAYKTPQKNGADALAKEGDSEACEDLIAGVKAGIDTLAYDESKDLEWNKAAIEALVADLADALIAQRNEDAADAVDALIDAIATPVAYPASKGGIDAAREAYDALTPERKALVDDLDDLESAEETYANLKADNDAADAVDALINAITIPVAYPASKEAIDAARTAYEALTPAQKELVDAFADLEDAENAYEVAEVEALIEAIGTVEYTVESKAKIDAAMLAFATLTEEQKALVENHVDLPTAETTYQQLENEAKAGEVKTLIAAIGEVKYPDSGKSIERARTAYDALTATQKEIVENYDVLKAAESSYATLEEEANKAAEKHGFCLGWVAFILMILVCLFLAFYLLLWLPATASLVEKLKLARAKALLNKAVLFGFADILLLIGGGAAAAVCIFALVALCLHVCAVSIISLVLSFLIVATFGVLCFFIKKKAAKVAVAEHAPVDAPADAADDVTEEK